jgi:type VI secretion system protein ImpL
MIWALVSASVLLAAVWTAALLLGWVILIPIALSVLLVAALGLALALRHARSRQRAAQLEAELRPPSSAERGGIGPAEAELQSRIRELTGALRRRHHASALGDAALYAVPWVLVLGPAGAGKSTALATSGLTLRAAGGRAPESRSNRASHECEPWLTDHGVLIDTPGRYVAEQRETAEWAGLLAALRRARRKRPLDGVVLVYSLAELLGDPLERLEEKARCLRRCLEELGSELGSVLPVYLLLTKADALPGFDEFCAGLPLGTRDRVWGATLESDAHQEQDAVTAFKAEFDLMKAVLHAQLLLRPPGRERTPEACAQALLFPVEFENVRAPLARLIEELFRTSRYQEAPVLRGFYCSSSANVPSGAAFAQPAPATRFVLHTSSGPAALGSSFLAELFPRIVFADRHLATRSRRGLWLDRRKQVLLAAAALALTLTGVLPAVVSSASNLALIDSTLDDARRAEQLASSRPRAGTSSESLDVLAERYEQLELEVGQFHIAHFWGQYSAAPLRNAVRARYLEQLRSLVHGPLRQRLSAAIRSASDIRGLDPAGFEAAFRDLELYLMLAHPDRLELEFATTALAQAWSRGRGPEPDLAAKSSEAHVRNYLEVLNRDPSWAWTADEALVTRARAQLASLPIEEIKYAALEQASAGAPPVLPEHIFVGEAARYVSTRGKVEVPGLYTALGWQKVQPLLEPNNHLDFAPWVLGEQTSQAPSWSVEQMRKLYFDRYVRAWMDFLVGLDVATPGDLGAAVEELAALGKAEGPYVRLFRRLAENARLELKPAGLEAQARAQIAQVTSQVSAGEKPAPTAPERRVSPVEQYFRRMVRFGFGDATPAAGMDLPPSLLNQYLDQLRALEVSLHQLQDSGMDPSVEFAGELARTSTSIERLLAGFDQTERLALEPVLLNPIRGSQHIIEAKGRAALSDRWRVEVWESYRRLVTHYPFVPESGSAVALPDFAEFFRPQTGTFWRFYEQTLASRFMHSGDHFVPRPSELAAGFRSDFLHCLSSAQQIAEALFVDGAANPAVPFKVKMQPVDARVSEITFILDGETLSYRNEPEKWRALQWPGKNGPAGASLQVKGADFSALVQRDDGDFGFLRLLAAGDIKPVSPGSLTLEASWRFRLNGSESRVMMQFQAPRQRHPFLPGFFSRLNCPPALTLAHGSR